MKNPVAQPIVIRTIFMMPRKEVSALYVISVL